MQEFLNYMFRNSHSKVQKLFNLLICETQLHKMIRYYTTLNHFGNAALVWKLVSLPIELLGLVVRGGGLVEAHWAPCVLCFMHKAHSLFAFPCV